MLLFPGGHLIQEVDPAFLGPAREAHRNRRLGTQRGDDFHVHHGLCGLCEQQFHFLRQLRQGGLILLLIERRDVDRLDLYPPNGGFMGVAKLRDVGGDIGRRQNVSVIQQCAELRDHNRLSGAVAEREGARRCRSAGVNRPEGPEPTIAGASTMKGPLL